MSGFIPGSPGDLTPEWITNAMRDAGALPHGRVREIRIESISDGGTGFTGETVRVTLTTEGADGAPESVIAKFPTRERQNRGMLENFDAYAREIRFYREFAHRMPCPTPTFLGGAYDEGSSLSGSQRVSRLVDALPAAVQLAITKDVTRFMRASKRRYALLIEDLGGDTTVHDLIDPPDDDQLAAALDVLASVHAAFWNDSSLADNDIFRTILTRTPGLYQTVGRRRCLPLAREQWSSWFTDDHERLLSDALDRFPDDVALMNEPITLIHGDPRSDNILYRDDGQVVLLDWALAGFAHPGYDVGYLLSSCLSEERLAGAEDLVAGYERGLVERGVDVDGAGLRAAIAATYRGQAVQILMSVAVLRTDSYDGDSMDDLWMPRLLAGLAHEW
ncbi:MAG: phosphotransferase [Acidimicrobiales bacterium]|nr:MAG: phosphotransferase [Acidimicrobiales bacterium]